MANEHVIPIVPQSEIIAERVRDENSVDHYRVWLSTREIDAIRQIVQNHQRGGPAVGDSDNPINVIARNHWFTMSQDELGSIDDKLTEAICNTTTMEELAGPITNPDNMLSRGMTVLKRENAFDHPDENGYGSEFLEPGWREKQIEQSVEKETGIRFEEFCRQVTARTNPDFLYREFGVVEGDFI